jgi:osmotically-inducible protein OsmY
MEEADSRLQQDVIDELGAESDLDTATIGVTVKDGFVELLGHVHNVADKHTAERAVKRIAGVRGVHDKLKIVRE